MEGRLQNHGIGDDAPGSLSSRRALPAREQGTSLSRFEQMFPDEDACLEHVFQTRFGTHHPCKCGKPYRWYRIRKLKRYGHPCGNGIYPLGGTIFHKTRIPIRHWFLGMLFMTNSRSGVSSHFLQRMLGIHPPTAWHMADRIRLQMALLEGRRTVGGPGKLVYVDETLMKGVRTRGRRGGGKAILFGMRDADHVVSAVVPNRSKPVLFDILRERVHPDSILVTDAWPAYRNLREAGWRHEIVNHAAGQWVNRRGYSTAPVEQYWAYFKRSFRATYLHAERTNLWKFLKEFEFRYNRRNCADTLFPDLIGRFPSVAEENLESVRKYSDYTVPQALGETSDASPSRTIGISSLGRSRSHDCER